MKSCMKTITIDDAIYGKLVQAKTTLGARSFSEVLHKLFSEDRVSWVYAMAGKVEINEVKITRLNRKWKEWHTQ